MIELPVVHAVVDFDYQKEDFVVIQKVTSAQEGERLALPMRKEGARWPKCISSAEPQFVKWVEEQEELNDRK